MTSKIKVDNINKVSDDSTIIKKCGSTTTVGSGSGQTIVVDGATVTLGRCGGAVNLASGASQSGFGRTGTVDWQTSSIKTSTFTATSGEGYFVNTTGGAVTVNLPAGVAGAIVGLKDYAGTWQTNAVTLNPNGSDNIGGGNTVDPTLAAEGGSVLLVFVDSTQGWLPTQQSVTASPSGDSDFITATGGTITTCGNFKIHTFNASGCFAVTQGQSAPNNKVSYVVVAGGGGTAVNQAGGAGAGGFREGKCSSDPYADSPLDSGTAITVTTQTYPITVGAGGPGPQPTPAGGTSGSPSIFATITSAGGGGGGGSGSNTAKAGGSGGGGGEQQPGAAGNTPPVSPPQGQNGGPSGSSSAAGGGGASATGGASGPGGGSGGAGVTSSITGSPVTRAGGGGGGSGGPAPGGGGGPGGGGAGGANAPASGSPSTAGIAGTANTGGGAGGGGVPTTCGGGASGGSGVVILRYKFQ